MIAVQLYTLRSLLDDRPRVLHALREIGYRTVEVAALTPGTEARFGEELRQAGLNACAAHVGLERITKDLDQVAAECRSWGCDYVVVPSVPDSYRSAEGFRRFAAEAAGIAGRLKAHGLRLAYHNHAFELERFGDRTGLEIVFSDPSIEAEVDTYWLQFGGVNPASWIRKFKDRTPLVHLKDMAIIRGHPVDAEIGEGNLDWKDILSACRDARARWLIVEQDDPRRDPLESVAMSYAYLQKAVQ